MFTRLKAAHLLLIVIATAHLSGCVSAKLYKSNSAFESSNTRYLYGYGNESKVYYLGEHENMYWYKMKDYCVTYGLPLENNENVIKVLDNCKYIYTKEGDAMFITNSHDKTHINDMSYPNIVTIDNNKSKISFKYMSKNSIIETKPVENDQGLSIVDSLILGTRRIGYVFTVPADVVYFPVMFVGAICVYAMYGGGY